MLWVLLAIAQAGYGDPVSGVPNYAERSMHVWTNRVRIDPSHYATEYDCAFGAFRSSEQTSKRPLKWNDDLGLVARSHSEDMSTHDTLSHTSSDGTPFSARVGNVYDGFIIGENVAYGYPSPFSVVVEGWMCSDGHRSNIMDADYDELGTGAAGIYWTQDFGTRDVDPGLHAARLGIHEPENPMDTATFIVAVYASDGEPARVDAVVNNAAYALDRELGNEDGTSGIFSATIDVVDACTHYWFEVERQDGRVDRYPEGGAYGFGDCTWTDADARWTAMADLPELTVPTEEEVPAGCGCASQASPVFFAWLPLLLVARRRSDP